MSYISRKYRYMNEYDIHKALINEYVLKTTGDTKRFKRDASRDKKDIDVIRDNHKFLWNDDETAAAATTWEEQLAKRYYDKLFKEYCICDLSRHKENKVALRWRIEREVVAGKGQFSCASKKCSVEDGLRTWEVNFAYQEQSERKNALVKIRLCAECSEKLNYCTKKREVKRLKKRRLQNKQKEQPAASSSDGSDAEESQKTEGQSVGVEVPAQEDAEAPWENLRPQREKTQEEEIDEYLADLLF